MKKLLITAGLVAALAVPFTAFAATSDAPAAKTIRSFCKIDPSTLTDKQKADLEETQKKMADLRKENMTKMMELKKESINKMIENGTITKEEGEAYLKKMEDMQQFKGEKGLEGPKMGIGMKKGKGFEGRGMGMEGRKSLKKSAPAAEAPVQ